MNHVWSGWPGAYCLNCGCEDPCEIALADGSAVEVPDDSEMGFHFEFPTIPASAFECLAGDKGRTESTSTKQEH